MDPALAAELIAYTLVCWHRTMSPHRSGVGRTVPDRRIVVTAAEVVLVVAVDCLVAADCNHSAAGEEIRAMWQISNFVLPCWDQVEDHQQAWDPRCYWCSIGLDRPHQGDWAVMSFL